MKTVFISDLHLEEKRPDITEIFLKFLHSPEVKQARALYILGDLFESWVGDDLVSPFHQNIVSALRQITLQGLPIYITHGNRDFLIGKRFLRLTGCSLLPDEHVINLNGVPTLLMHGDTLCTEDKAYLQFRKKTRNWFVQKFFLMKSLKKRLAIAEKMRSASQAYMSTVPESILDVTQTEVERVMQKHGVPQLIHGHTHRPFVHQFEVSGNKMTRIVLSPWHEKGHALVSESSGENNFLQFK